MHYLHHIEVTDNGEEPQWFVIAPADGPEEHDSTAADYGREALQNYIDDNPEDPIVDEYGNPLLRIVVAFADDPDAFASPENHVVTIESDALDEPPAEIAKLEAARENKLHVRHLDLQADERLTQALTAARAQGSHSANHLAELVYPAVSRPIALRMMKP